MGGGGLPFSGHPLGNVNTERGTKFAKLYEKAATHVGTVGRYCAIEH